MLEDNNGEEKDMHRGVKYRLESVNCGRCYRVHKLFEGFGDGALYWCGNELLQISEGDNINIDFGC